jgi:hypothetical protein
MTFIEPVPRLGGIDEHPICLEMFCDFIELCE